MILKALFERIPAVLCQGSWDTDIASIAMCSKEVTNNSLFICIKGMEQDGHQYIQEAAERGAAACLVEEAFWKKSASVHGNLKQAEKKTSAYGELKLPEIRYITLSAAVRPYNARNAFMKFKNHLVGKGFKALYLNTF